jgi:DNA-binding response OmpR family regulator
VTESLPKSAGAGSALVVSKEAPTRQLISESLQQLAIRPEICLEAFVAAGLLDKQKFEAVIVDLLLGDEALLVLARLRFSRANRTAVSFAITTESESQTATSAYMRNIALMHCPLLLTHRGGSRRAFELRLA